MQTEFSTQQKIATYASLFLVLIIDSMGIGLVMPLLGPLFISRHSALVAASLGLGMRDFLYGLTLASFCVAMFFGAPFLGDLSDHLGRKRVLLLCLFGTAFGLMVSAFGVNADSVVLLIFGRVIAGFMSGSVSMASAAIVDISSPASKTINLSLITFASCVGFTLGPLLAGVLVTPSFIKNFGYALPFWSAAILAFVNGLALCFTFRETFFPKAIQRLRLTRGVDIFISAFTNKHVRRLAIVYLLAEAGWALFFQFLPLYLMRTYNYDALYIAYTMSWMGLIFAISLLLLIRIATKYLSNSQLVFYGILATMGGILLLLIPNTLVMWLALIPSSIGGAFFYVALLALFSDSVGDDKQGWVMGVFAAVIAVSWSITGLISGLLGAIDVYVPIILAAMFLFLGAIFSVKIVKNITNVK
ncbi:MAG: MFS transporter [Gammaproteobacteria bacterium]|nr:MFS transporter [Gammaproteobacteria bacterium]